MVGSRDEDDGVLRRVDVLAVQEKDRRYFLLAFIRDVFDDAEIAFADEAAAIDGAGEERFHAVELILSLGPGGGRLPPQVGVSSGGLLKSARSRPAIGDIALDLLKDLVK